MMRCLFLVLAVLIGAVSTAQARCEMDDHSFLGSIGCEDEWNSQIEMRMRTLDALNNEYDALAAEHASLSTKVDVERRIVAQLQSDVADEEATLRRLQGIQLNNSNALQVLATLDANARALQAQLETLLRIHSAHPQINPVPPTGGTPQAQSFWEEVKATLRKVKGYVSEIHNVADAVKLGIRAGQYLGIFSDEADGIAADLLESATFTGEATEVAEVGLMFL